MRAGRVKDAPAAAAPGRSPVVADGAIFISVCFNLSAAEVDDNEEEVELDEEDEVEEEKADEEAEADVDVDVAGVVVDGAEDDEDDDVAEEMDEEDCEEVDELLDGDVDVEEEAEEDVVLAADVPAAVVVDDEPVADGYNKRKTQKKRW